MSILDALVFRTRLWIELGLSMEQLVSFYPMDQIGPLTSVVILEVKITDSRKNEGKERSANPPPPLERKIEAPASMVGYLCKKLPPRLGLVEPASY